MTAPDESTQAWDLVEAAKRGDRAAFGELYSRYAPGVSRFVAARTGNNRPLAEDLTSETFARALRRIDSVTYQGKDPSAWLTTIARNLVYDDTKSSRFKLETPTAEMRDGASTERGVEQTVIDRATAAEVRRHVAQLPPDQRQSIYHRFFEDLSVADTAAAMGRNEGAVKALQHRGITKLRAALAAPTTPVRPRRDTAAELAAARGAVAEVHRLVAGDDHERTDELDRAQELTRWHADDQVAALVEQREQDALTAGGAA